MSTENNNQNASGGIGFNSVLFVVFLVLKLLHKIDWSWIWVTAPLWIPIAILFAFSIIWVFAIVLLAATGGDFRKK